MSALILKSFRHLYELLKVYLAIGLLGVLAALAYGALSVARSGLPSRATSGPPFSYIFEVALCLFLVLGSADLVIEQLITLVIFLKKLKTTTRRESSLESGQIKRRSAS